MVFRTRQGTLLFYGCECLPGGQTLHCSRPEDFHQWEPLTNKECFSILVVAKLINYMKKVIIEGKLCIGPTFSNAEFALIKRNLAEQKGIDTLAYLLEAAGNIQRLKILYLLFAHKEMCVCDIAEVLGISDSAVSQHLRKLKDKHLIRNRRKGQTIYYSLINNPFLENLTRLFSMEESKFQHSFAIKERS